MTTTTADPFAGLDTFADDTDALATRFAEIVADITPAPVVRCTRCGRRLRKPSATGMGPVCTRKAKAALTTLADYTPQQIEKAEELIELGGVIRLNAAEFEVIGSKGDRYVTDGARCGCPAGEHGRRCYHLAVVATIAA